MKYESKLDIWKDIQEYYLILKEWFDKRDIYHKVGYLVAIGKSLKTIIDDSKGLTKKAFEAGLDQAIMNELGLVPSTSNLKKLGVNINNNDFVVALAGNPNTGKSTVFNALTGLRQHTGNWPGKTVSRAEGGYSYNDKKYKLVDLPGTYSLLSASQDEEIARNFILFGKPDVTIIVVDATRLERNLNLVLQLSRGIGIILRLT
mgnify:CR=1 FL=1